MVHIFETQFSSSEKTTVGRKSALDCSENEIKAAEKVSRVTHAMKETLITIIPAVD